MRESIALLTILFIAWPVSNGLGGPLDPKVPEDELVAARAEINPLAATPGNVGRGRAVYEGKGACYLCHGEDGSPPNGIPGRTT